MVFFFDKIRNLSQRDKIKLIDETMNEYTLYPTTSLVYEYKKTSNPFIKVIIAKKKELNK